MNAGRNNIGVLRLVLASLVIVGHAPEMVDGSRARDPVFALCRCLSLGTLAVDAFFFVSGILITKSMLNALSLGSYFTRRVCRIYPAFGVAYLISVYALGPLVGAHPLASGVYPLVLMAVLRAPPDFPGQLAGLHYPALNGAMWSIAYEFRCYILVALLGSLTLLPRRRLILALAACALLGSVAATYSAPAAFLTHFGQYGHIGSLLGSPVAALPLTAAFLVGASFHLFREQLDRRLSGMGAMVCALFAVASMACGPHVAETGAIVFGAVTLYWVAYLADLGRFQRVNESWDISYGVYLYGWPVATALLWFDRDISPLALGMTALPLAWLCGSASWVLVEQWTKDLFSRRGSRQRLVSGKVVTVGPTSKASTSGAVAIAIAQLPTRTS